MNDPSMTAFWFGLISAVSLPLGALTLLVWRPGDKTTAFLMAFGSGALIAALTLDLVAPAISHGHFYPLAAGCILGGLLFLVLDRVISHQGGFLRKASTTIQFLKKKKIESCRELSDRLGRIDLFRHLPPADIQTLLPYIQPRTFPKGSTIIRQGEPSDSFYIIDHGHVEIVDIKNQMKRIADLGDNDVFGEIGLITGEMRTMTAVAAQDTRTWVILKEHFDRLAKAHPSVAMNLSVIAKNRLTDLHDKNVIDAHSRKQWSKKAYRYIDEKIILPTRTDIKEAVQQHPGAPLAIFLGVFLDGIPESLVIGVSMIHAPVSLSLIAGLFLSNFPEALSSSAGMREQGFPMKRILLMWVSLMLFTGLGAWTGNITMQETPAGTFALIEGIAAGAMLTMIAQTMLPESAYKGGSLTGLSTLLGFLAAVFFKTLQH